MDDCVERLVAVPHMSVESVNAFGPAPDVSGRRSYRQVRELVERAGPDRFVSANLLNNFHNVVHDLGGNPEALLAEAGIDYAALNRGTSVVSGRAVGELFEKTSETLNCPDFGLRLAAQQSCDMVTKPLNRLMFNAPTIGDSLRCCVDHRNAFSSGISVTLKYDAEQALIAQEHEILGGVSLYPQLAEQIAQLAHNAIIYLSGGFARSRMVWFSHLRVGSQAAYARRFGVPVKFGQEYDGVFVTEADLKAKVVDSNANVFASEMHVIASRFPVYRPDTAMEVRRLLYRTLSTAVCSREKIATSLGLQERTLNRRLRQLGTNFEMIRDEVRRNLAIRYLARGDLSVTEIAGRLGYSELAVLSRSCRRWFNRPPRELQRRLV